MTSTWGTVDLVGGGCSSPSSLVGHAAPLGSQRHADRWNASRAWLCSWCGPHADWACWKSGQAEKILAAYGEVATWVCVSTMLLAGLLVVLSLC